MHPFLIQRSTWQPTESSLLCPSPPLPYEPTSFLGGGNFWQRWTHFLELGFRSTEKPSSWQPTESFLLGRTHLLFGKDWFWFSENLIQRHSWKKSSLDPHPFCGHIMAIKDPFLSSGFTLQKFFSSNQKTLIGCPWMDPLLSLLGKALTKVENNKNS